MSHTVLIQEIEGWLIDEALGDPDITQLFETLCQRLNGVGVPVHRSSLVWPTLHPLFQSEQIFWNPEEGAKLLQYEHVDQRTEAWDASPFAHAIEHRLNRIRRRLVGPDTLLDFPVLEEFKEQGYTDYLLTSSAFRIAEISQQGDGKSGIMGSWATKRDGGFSDADIEALSRIQKAFAVAARTTIQRRVTANLVNTYLGPTAGWRALTGAIRRGDGEQIRAVVFYADLRGSTALSDKMESQEYLTLLKAYYDCVAQPVIEEGGEILDYIGDAVLAIFPIRGDTAGPEAVRAACRAMEKALETREAKVQAGEEMRFSISLAVGEVMFGNIGVPERLSFSVIGPVVNQVSRMDDASKTLGRSVLVTKDIAAIESQCWVSLGDQDLAGMTEPVELFARSCERDAFSIDEMFAATA